MDRVADGLVRALCFYDAIDYPPTWAELMNGLDIGNDLGQLAMSADVMDRAPTKLITQHRGRVVFAGRESLIAEHEVREALFPRKIRRARSVAGWLARLGGVRFVALCNTTALAHARDEGDLDFFVITKRGTLWQTRGLATLPFALTGQRPRANESRRDAVCLSFFIDETALDLTPLQIENDVYFRHWFLSLLPLHDDGVSQELWQANSAITQHHPLARPWIVNPDLSVVTSQFQIPAFRFFEPTARSLQMERLNSTIKSRMNQDTCVVVNDRVLKFHVEDGRKRYREAYRQNCQRYGIES